ncbi:queuosine precursor transporter [Methanobrevibacter sp.]|uniref:queuosine precursor transporter n=1 Tax=Methanobrevibacter sp. TaxID=66852 RepID=UPI0025FD8CCE|nr:queuosine precursor transporter [Methanobrevibacter sp.]
MFENLTKKELYAILTGVFTACLIISNVIAGKTFDFFSFALPCGVVIFPVIYIVNDVLTEVYGYERARNVILLGFFDESYSCSLLFNHDCTAGTGIF